MGATNHALLLGFTLEGNHLFWHLAEVILGLSHNFQDEEWDVYEAGCGINAALEATRAQILIWQKLPKQLILCHTKTFHLSISQTNSSNLQATVKSPRLFKPKLNQCSDISPWYQQNARCNKIPKQWLQLAPSKRYITVYPVSCIVSAFVSFRSFAWFTLVYQRRRGESEVGVEFYALWKELWACHQGSSHV